MPPRFRRLAGQVIAAAQAAITETEQERRELRDLLDDAPSPTEMAALTHRVSALEDRQPQLRAVTVAVPNLLAGASAEVTATWDPAFAGSSYQAVVLHGPALVGKIATSVASKTADSTVVAVTNTTLPALGVSGVVHVVAFEYPPVDVANYPS